MSEILFGRLLESNNNNDDGDLNNLQRQLKNKIEKAKLLASSLKSTHESQDNFATTSNGGVQQEYFRLYKLKNRKKNRRLDVEIEKKFECPYEKCYKIYGSDVSLNLHIKLKHNGGNKTDRESLAEQICLAELNKQDLPMMRFNLPPGYLQDYRNNHFMKKPMIGKIQQDQQK